MSRGIGLSGLVFIVFLILKLTEVGIVANWSWVWICAPLWIPFAIWGVIILGGLILTAIGALLYNIFKK